MNVKLENIEKNVVKLEIEVDAEKFEEGLQYAYNKNKGRFAVNGFRKGKVPRNIIERVYGVEVLYEDAINFVCPEAYDQAVKENDLHPVEQPEIDIVSIGKGEKLVFTAKVTVKPEVELGQYKEIEVEKVEVKVTEEDVENEIKKEVEKNARMITVEDRAIEKGDMANIDFEGFLNGEPFEGGKGEKYELEIGSGTFIPGFEDQLIGANKGDEVDVNVTFPEEYDHKELAGKPALFKVKVNEIRKKVLPEVDDEFAKDVSEFETLEEYKADILKKLTEKAQKEAEEATREKVLQKVVDNANIDLPQVMIENRIDHIVQDFERRLNYSYGNLGLETYLKYTNQNMEDFRKQFAERAENEVRTQLVIDKIRDIENITATDEDVQEEIKKLAEMYRQTEEEFKKHLSDRDIEYIKEDLRLRKTIDFLVENAKIA
ncbi:MAG TPA: trigger factor [Clostridiaceae bacterium]|nr:trigger factor [Clostridiaceae bacterium]